MEDNGKERFSSKFFRKSWLLFSSIMTAISLINIGKDLGLAIKKWSEFLIKTVQLVESIRDFVLAPFTHLVEKLIHIPIPGTIKSYIFILLLFKSIKFQFLYSVAQRRVRWIFILYVL